MRAQLQKVFKNDNFLSLASNLGIAVFGTVSFLLLVRIFKPAVYGEWVIFIVTGNFFEMLRFGITRTAIIRFLSGAKEDDRKKLIGSNWFLGLISTLILAALIYIVYLLFPTRIEGSGYELFFIWYPILSFLNLPFNNAITILHADQKFGRIFMLQMLNNAVFAVFLALNLFVLHWDLMPVLYAFLISKGFSSLICMIFGWDGFKNILKTTKESNKTILNFGKYSTGTLIGANLLKSSDTWLLGLSPFIGPVGVAMYNVPLKLTEILEIPLRSFVATAFPKMSKASLEGRVSEVKRIYYSYSGGLTFILLPIVVICFIFAEEFVYILGGAQYVETKNIFRFFCIYGLFISVDKFTGVALDSINQPKKNFFKVVYMATANVLGDIFAIFYASKFLLAFSVMYLMQIPGFNLFGLFEENLELSVLTILELVSFVTILFTIIGILIGIIYLKREIKINLRFIPVEGWKFFTSIVRDTLGLFFKRKTL